MSAGAGAGVCLRTLSADFGVVVSLCTFSVSADNLPPDGAEIMLIIAILIEAIGPIDITAILRWRCDFAR